MHSRVFTKVTSLMQIRKVLKVGRIVAVSPVVAIVIDSNRVTGPIFCPVEGIDCRSS